MAQVRAPDEAEGWIMSRVDTHGGKKQGGSTIQGRGLTVVWRNARNAGDRGVGGWTTHGR